MKIRKVAPTAGGGFSISYDVDSSMDVELIDCKRLIYRIKSPGTGIFSTPARNIHSFEVIEYVNNTGDLI